MDMTKRTPINEVYYGDHTDAQVKDAMNAAILAAVGIAAPKTTPQTPPRRRTPPTMTREWHDRLIAADNAAKGRTVREMGSAPNVVGVDVKQVEQITRHEIAKDVHRSEQSFVWREPVTVEEWLNGADGQYQSPFRQG